MSESSLRPPLQLAGPSEPLPSRWSGYVALVAVCLLSVGLSFVFLGMGMLSLPALAILGTLTVTVIVLRPEWMTIVAGMLLFFPGKRPVFPHEILLGLLFFMTVVDGIRRRDRSLLLFDRVELVNLAFVAWALVTVLWVTDFRIYLHGVRRLMGGVLAFWVAYRLARSVPRRTYELSLLATAYGLACSALGQYMIKTGFMRHHVSRGEATDLGWGKSNTIATMLLVLGPPIMDMAFRSRSRLVRWLAWPNSVLNGMMQMIIASRAATALYFGWLYVQLTAGRKRRLIPILIVTVVATAAILSPSGQMLLSRFSDLREMGGMVVRIWYAREALHRTVEGFPFGIGLNQGFVHLDKLNTMGTHDYWLDIASELGVLGIALWVTFLVVLWNRLKAVARTPGWAAEGTALQIAFWMSTLHTCVEPTFIEVHYQFVFFWVIGGYLGYHAIGATREAEEAREALERRPRGRAA